MKKTLSYIFALSLVLAAIACTNKEIDYVYPEYGDEYYVRNTSISSDSPYFTPADGGGAIVFMSAGGEVVVKVECGTEWTSECSASWLAVASSCEYGTLTLTAGQNTDSASLSGTVTLATADGTEFAVITVSQNGYGSPEISVGTTSWNVPAAGNLSTEIKVYSGVDNWEIETSCSWLMVEKTADGILLTADPNEIAQTRSTEVTLECGSGEQADSVTILVTQDARVDISSDYATLTFYTNANARIGSAVITANYDWTYTYDTSNGWFSVERDGDTLTATVTGTNEGEDNRIGIITLTGGDGAENVMDYCIEVKQLGSAEEANYMMLVYTTTSANTTVKLPLYGTVDCKVDWGDGTGEEEITSTLPQHTYASEGEHTVAILGSVTKLNSYTITAYIGSYLTEIRQWGVTGLTTMDNGFYKCTAITSLPPDTAGSFAELTTMSNTFNGCTGLSTISDGLYTYGTSLTELAEAFEGCTSLTEIPENLFANCVNLTVFRNVFSGCTGLKSIPGGLFSKLTGVTNFQYVFNGCSSLTEIPEDLFANCPDVTSFLYAFDGCTSLTSIPSKLFANCPKVQYFGYVFYDCEALTSIPEDLFEKNTAVTSFTNAFYKCKKLETVPESLFANCPEVTALDCVFYYCQGLKSIPENIFKYNTKATTFKRAFYYCNSMTEIPAGLFAYNTEVTSFEETFRQCTALTSIPEGLFDNNTKVTSFASVFRQCTSIESFPEGLFKNCPEVTTFNYSFYSDSKMAGNIEKLFENCLNVTNFGYAFYNCSSLTGESSYNIIEVDGESVKVHLYERQYYTDYFTKPTTTTYCFYKCTGLDDYNDGSIITGWK